MKHQYFGDINDYRKYGILRQLAAYGLKIAICWMLTENDSRSDGKLIKYLHQADKMRFHDPELFDALKKAVVKKDRKTDWIRDLRLIPNARYYDRLLNDDPKLRLKYFGRLNNIAKVTDLIFFDPDNGIEVKSVPKGKFGSHKYLYWDEIKQFLDFGYSLFIYQHFPRVNRLQYIRRLSSDLRKHTNASEVITFKTSTVVFFLLPQEEHRKKIHLAKNSIQTKWNGMIEVVKLL